MPSPMTVSIQEVEAFAADHNDLGVMLLADAAAEAMDRPCIVCRINAGRSAGIAFAGEEAARIRVPVADAEAGVVVIVPICEACDERLELNREFAGQVYERAEQLANARQLRVFAYQPRVGTGALRPCPS